MFFSAIVAIVQVVATQTEPSSWPGLGPDCWKENRLVHRKFHWRDPLEQVTLERRSKFDLSSEEKRLSPNNAYWMQEIAHSPDAVASVFAEKKHLLVLTFSDTMGIEANWANEKLLLIRVWWGRMAATDYLLDVENEKFVHVESLMSGHEAMAQYQEQCRIHGECNCE